MTIIKKYGKRKIKKSKSGDTVIFDEEGAEKMRESLWKGSCQECGKQFADEPHIYMCFCSRGGIFCSECIKNHKNHPTSRLDKESDEMVEGEIPEEEVRAAKDSAAQMLSKMFLKPFDSFLEKGLRVNTPSFPGVATNVFYSYFMVETKIARAFKMKDLSWKIRFFRDALEDAIKKGDDKQKAMALCNLALARYNTGNFWHARDVCEDALKISRGLAEKNTLVHALNTKAAIQREINKYSSSETIQILKENLEIIREVLKAGGDTYYLVAKATTLHNLGLLYRERWNTIDRKEQGAIYALNSAIKYSLDGLSVYRKLNDPYMIACELEIIAISYHFQNNLKEALKYYQEALDAWTKLGNKPAIGFNYSSIKTIEDHLEKSDKGKPVQEISSPPKKTIEEIIFSHPLATCVTCAINCEWQGEATSFGVCENYSEKKETETGGKKASKIQRKKPSIKKRKKKKRGKGDLLDQANEFRTSGNFQEAIECCENALEKDPTNSQARKLLGELYVEIGEYVKADECFKKVIKK